MSSLLWIVDLITKEFSLYFQFQLLLSFLEKKIRLNIEKLFGVLYI